MKKYAVALMKGENEMIMGLFKTKNEADMYGKNNPIPHSAGLLYCYLAYFKKGRPVGNIKIYDYYNVLSV